MPQPLIPQPPTHPASRSTTPPPTPTPRAPRWRATRCLARASFFTSTPPSDRRSMRTQGLWVASSPKDTETAGLTYLHGNWDIGFFNKRIGKMYNHNGAFNQAVALDPFNITHLFFNNTLKQTSFLP